MDDLITRMTGSLSRRRAMRNQAPVPYSGTRGGLFSSDTDAVQSVGERAYEAYGSVGTLFAIVSQIGNAFATTDWHLYRRTSLRDKKRRTEVLNHGFMAVWDKPNDFYTGRFF